MPVAVIDVGSNTIRLLVARIDGGDVVPVDKSKVRLALGEEIERDGALSDLKIARAAKAVRKLAKVARAQGVDSVDVFLTAPGRQSANAAELVAALAGAAEGPVRVLSTSEEGRLAYGGAVATAAIALPETIAVCDVGGASTEIAVGSPGGDPTWIESVDLGSVRLTVRAGSLENAWSEAARAFADVEPPPVEAAIAVGGSARAVRRLVGARLGAKELDEALTIVQHGTPRSLSRLYGVDRARARILPAGVVLLTELQRRLGVPLEVSDGGIREGAVLAAARSVAA